MERNETSRTEYNPDGVHQHVLITRRILLEIFTRALLIDGLIDGRLNRSQTNADRQTNETTRWTNPRFSLLRDTLYDSIVSHRFYLIELSRGDYSAATSHTTNTYIIFSHIKTCCKFSFAFTVHSDFHGFSKFLRR